MAFNVEIPIRTKLVAFAGALVVALTGSYLALATHLFKDDKTSLVYELNASNVKTLAAETEAHLLKVADKIQLLTQGHRDEAWVRAIFEAEPDLISYALFRNDSGKGEWVRVASVRNTSFLRLYGLEAAEVDRIREKIPVPFAKVLSRKSWAMNSTLPGGAPVLTLALALEIRDGAVTEERVAVADLRMDKILKTLGGRGIATPFLVDGEGNVVAHPDPALVASRASLSDLAIVRDGLQSPVAFLVKRFEWNGKSWLGAMATVGVGGLTAVSQAEEAQVFRAARKLIEKSVMIALIFVTAALLAATWMAGGLTSPIERLVAATERLSRWEFGQTVHVETRDEIGRLARSFNAMAGDLQSQKAQIDANRAELELKVKERTATLESQKKQLSEAQDSLIRTTRLASLGELAGATAHEILNPVNNINIRIERIREQLRELEPADARLLGEIAKGWKEVYEKGGIESLEKELLKPAQDGSRKLVDEDLENLTSIAADLTKRVDERGEDIEFIGREITRVTRLINNMRSLSRVGGERRLMDVHAPLDDTLVTLGDLFEKRKITVLKEYAPESRDLFSVVGDRDELVQVFSNLFRNAAHAIGEAGRRSGVLRIATRRNGSRIEIRVHDNGTGILSVNLPRVFEPSFTTKSVEEGTGLGLSISRRLIRAFDGDIEIEHTVEGEGTTFLVWLPAVS